MIEMLMTLMAGLIFAVALSYDDGQFNIRIVLTMVMLVLGTLVMLGNLPLGMIIIPVAGYIVLWVTGGEP